jgi:hypothetical protein
MDVSVRENGLWKSRIEAAVDRGVGLAGWLAGEEWANLEPRGGRWNEMARLLKNWFQRIKSRVSKMWCLLFTGDAEGKRCMDDA